MQFDNTATLDALAKLPPEAPKIAESKSSAWTAPLRAVPAAAAEALAGAAEVGTAAYRSLQQMDEGGASGRRQRDRFGIRPVSGETEVSRSLRNVAESYGPDPATAGEAERLVFGLTRGIGKAVAYGLTTGPAAPFLFGADEGLTTMDQLQRQGIDTATAAKAGAVSGVVNAAGFLVPVAGKTVAGTIGLGTLSGPASFVAQQASTREILRAADYGRIAEQFDPFDPVGLGASLLPFGFGAWAMRGKIKGARPEPAQRIEPTMPADTAPARPVDAAPATTSGPVDAAPAAAAPVGDTVAPSEVAPVARPEVAREHVDAAMVHNLTLAADHAEAMHSPPMESLADFSARVMPPASDAAPARAGPDPFIKFLKANGGVNFADKFDITGEANGIRLNRGGVFTKAGRGLDDLAQIAESEGWLPPGSTADVDGGVPQLRDMLQRSMSGERIKPLAQQFDDMASRQMATSEQMRAESLAHRLEMLGVDPTPARGDADVMAAYLDQHEPRLLRQALADIAEPEAPAPTQPKGPAPDVPTTQELGAQAREAPSPQAEAQAEAAAAIEPGSGPDAALIESVRRRGEQVVAEAPDLVVGMTEDGRPITAKQEMERIRREAAEGTADELGANDAALLDIAVQCALSVGE